MGLIEMYGRWIQGKPVFQPENQQNTPTEQPPTEGIEQQGPKQIPVLRIEQTHCHVNGHHMEVRLHFKNESSQFIEVDKIFILGAKREIDLHLKPYEAREAVVYSGNRPKNTNYGSADINYKTKEPPVDYFQLKCRVEFKPEQDKTYSVYRVTAQGPIKDIQ
jgi:hypothetical protein